MSDDLRRAAESVRRYAHLRPTHVRRKALTGRCVAVLSEQATTSGQGVLKTGTTAEYHARPDVVKCR